MVKPLNRERFAELNLDTFQCLRELSALRTKNPDSPCISKNDFVAPIHNLYKIWWDNYNRERILLFSKRTAKRVGAMNVSSLLGPIDKLSSILQKDEYGYIIIPKESWNDKDDLNAFYAIQDGKMWMHVCEGLVKVGYIVLDKDFSPYVELLPYSVITMLRLKKFPHRDEMKRYEDMFTVLLQDFPEIMSDDTDTFLKKVEDKKFFKKYAMGKSKAVPLFQMHAFAWKLVFMAFKAFIFLKTSEVYTAEYIPDSSPSYIRAKKEYKPMNYIQIDVTYDMDIDVNTPFPVSGHFTHQPYKDKEGKWQRKLIYIEQYMKKGYHRKAKKTLLNM